MDARDSCEDYNCREEFFSSFRWNEYMCKHSHSPKCTRTPVFRQIVRQSYLIGKFFLSLRLPSPSSAWSFNFHSLYIHRCGYYFSCFLFDVACTMCVDKFQLLPHSLAHCLSLSHDLIFSLKAMNPIRLDRIFCSAAAATAAVVVMVASIWEVVLHANVIWRSYSVRTNTSTANTIEIK